MSTDEIDEIVALLDEDDPEPLAPDGPGVPADGPATRRRAAQRLYTRFHLRQPARAAGPVTVGDTDASIALWALLRAELGGHTGTEHGWVRVASPDGDGSDTEILRRPDGLLVRRRRPLGPEPPEPERTPVTVEWPRLQRTVPRGWIWFTGGPERDDLDMRVYIGLTGDDRPHRWAELVMALRDKDLPFRTKILGDPATTRPDNVVVYVRGSDLTRVLAIVDETVPARARLDRTAGFGVPVGPAVSVAHPEEDEDPLGSLGMQRCERAYDLATEGDAPVVADRLRELARILDLQQARVRSLVGVSA